MDDRVIERSNPLDAFAKSAEDDVGTSIVPAGVFAAPAERVFGAQPVAIKRDDSDILKKLKAMAAAAGDDWFYRFPVKAKVKDEATGQDKWVTDYIEGPSIKCANNVSRLYGNCDIDTRVFDMGDSYMFYARFMDLETGYSLTRPFRQRKGQKVMKTDAGRQEDIVFQIGASKAIRNVVNNALEFFTNYAANEAKNSIIEKVGKALPQYREKVLGRLADMKVDVKRVEIVRGRPAKDWLAADVARTIAEIQAINDGMANIDDTYPPLGGQAEEATTQTDSGGTGLDNFANSNGGEQQQRTEQSSQANAPTTGKPAGGEAAPAKESPKVQQAGAAEAAGDKPKGGKKEAEPVAREPTSDAEYSAYAAAWIAQATDADAAETRWKAEKQLRRKAIISQESFEELESALKAKVAELRGGK